MELFSIRIQRTFQLVSTEEKNEVPKEYAGMKVESKGFYEPVVVQDFPIRGKKLF